MYLSAQSGSVINAGISNLFFLLIPTFIIEPFLFNLKLDNNTQKFSCILFLTKS